MLNHLVKVVGPALMVGIAQGTSPPAQHFGDFLHLMTTDQLASDNVLLTTVVHIEMLAASTKTKDIWRVGVLEIALVSFVDNVDLVIQKRSFLQSVSRTTTAKIIGSGKSYYGSWFWPVVLLYSFAFSFFLLRKSSIIGYARRILPWARKRAAVSDLTSDGSGYVKVIFYFYQVAGLVFVSKDSEMHLAENYLLLPVMGWFDFKAIGLKGGLVCPFLGLTVVSKIFLQASQVFAVLFGVLLIFVVNGAKRKIQRKRPVFPPADQYLAATVDCLVLSYSTLALTSLKALNCTLYRLFQFCIADLNCSLVKKFPRSGSCMLVCVPCSSPFGGWFFARRFPLLMQRPTKLAMNNCLCYLHVQVPQETIYPRGLEPSLHDLVE